MRNVEINVFNIVRSPFCVEANDGQRVFESICNSFEQNRKVILSFSDIEIFTIAFFHTAVGQLYEDFSETKIKNSLELKDITPSGAVILKRMVDSYYKTASVIKPDIDTLLD
jgi:hypothetical protein